MVFVVGNDKKYTVVFMIRIRQAGELHRRGEPDR